MSDRDHVSVIYITIVVLMVVTARLGIDSGMFFVGVAVGAFVEFLALSWRRTHLRRLPWLKRLEKR